MAEDIRRLAKYQDSRSDLRFTIQDREGVTIIGTTTEELAEFILETLGDQ